MSQQPTEPDQKQTYRNNEQNRIINSRVATTNKTESTTDMQPQQTEPDQQQTCRNDQQNRINNRHAATTN
jgi:hypothetical protein